MPFSWNQAYGPNETQVDPNAPLTLAGLQQFLGQSEGANRRGYGSPYYDGLRRYLDQRPTPQADPTGFYPSPESQGDAYNPHQFMARFLQHPDTQGYASVGADTQTMGVDTARSGEARAIREARQGAATQGLGRGYAQQMESDITQEGTLQASQAMLQGRLEEKARRYKLQAMYTQALMEANKSRYAAYLSEQATEAAKDAGKSSMMGGIFSGLGALAGGIIGL